MTLFIIYHMPCSQAFNHTYAVAMHVHSSLGGWGDRTPRVHGGWGQDLGSTLCLCPAAWLGAIHTTAYWACSPGTMPVPSLSRPQAPTSCGFLCYGPSSITMSETQSLSQKSLRFLCRGHLCCVYHRPRNPPRSMGVTRWRNPCLSFLLSGSSVHLSQSHITPKHRRRRLPLLPEPQFESETWFL